MNSIPSLIQKDTLFKILKSRWEFIKPSESDILVYDALPSISENLQEILKEDTYQFFYTRGEVLNIPILFRTFIKTGLSRGCDAVCGRQSTLDDQRPGSGRILG